MTMPLPADIPPSLACRLPDAVLDVAEADRARRVVAAPETCQLDGRRYFLRGNIELPVKEAGASFVWTIWVEVEKTDFKHAVARWTRHDRLQEPPYSALLANYLPLYPATLGLACRVHTRLVGQRFAVELVAGDEPLHPLVAEQQEGVSVQRLREIVRRLESSAGS